MGVTFDISEDAFTCNIYCLYSHYPVAVLAQQSYPPDDIGLRFSYSVPEDTKVGAVLFNFTARYSDGHHHDVDVTISSSFFTVEKVSGSDGVWNVKLKAGLDREVRP